MNLKVLLVLLLLLVQASAQGVAAHHSTPVNFDQSKEITIEGVLHDGTRLNEDSETSDYADHQERRNSVGGGIVVVQNWTEELRRLVPTN